MIRVTGGSDFCRGHQPVYTTSVADKNKVQLGINI